MTCLSGDWFRDASVRMLAQAFQSAGYELYFVGGCVRNALMNRPISDLDLSTDARPEQVMALAKDCGFKPVPTGIEHGTVTVVAHGVGYEITTYRKDVKTDGRRAVVAFADRMEDDAHRRDFTMNALYADTDGRVIDPLGGLADLRAGRVRFIDDAAARIREDYLRVLRFFRFYAWYGNTGAGPDPDALAAISENLDGLSTLSKERVGAEFLKLLAAPDPAPAVALMAQSGVLARLLPGADPSGLPVLTHIEADLPPDPIRRLAAITGPDAAPLLRLSRKDSQRLQVLREGMGEMTPPAELAYRHGSDTAQNIVLLRAAQLGQVPDPSAFDAIKAGSTARFPVKPADLMPGLTGPALGEKLKELEARWISSGFALTREELLS